MKSTLFRKIALAMAAVSLCALPLSADQPRNGGRHTGASGSNRQHKETPASRGPRPGASSPSHSSSGSNRPGANSRPTTPSRPGNSGHNGQNHQGGNRPGLSGSQQGNHNSNGHNNGNKNHNNGHNNGHNQGYRPGLNDRPGNGPQGTHRPGNPGNPGHSHNQGFKPNPGHGPGHGPGYRPPFTPPRPFYRPPQPPHRPHGWVIPPRAPRIGSIFGLAFGTALNASLNFLLNQGYTVNGYDNSQVWLRNVSIANYVWPDAALYYGTGGLNASSFYYTSPYYDPSRYNAVYSQMMNMYGRPVNYSTTHGAMSASWLGASGYVTLTLGATTSGSYVTTLSFGL